MSAPLTDFASSISSSGHTDGLGRRVLAFDRETGAMLERLYLRAELSAFAAAIQERIAHLKGFDDERFGRVFETERDASTGELTVVSEFVAGHRLSDVLEAAQDGTVVPGVDVALGFLLEALPALSALHTAASFPHGLIDPSRTVLTSGGQIVFLDVAFGAVVERLGHSRQRLWTAFGIASPAGTSVARLDASTDISQIALSAVMLVLGRPLDASDYPDALPSLLMEVIDVAQIRGTTAFAGGLQRILQRSLPLPGRRPYTTADEMAADLRQLVRREIGVDVCRKALFDFIEQVDSAFGSADAHSVGTAAQSAVWVQHEEDFDDLAAAEEEIPDHEAPRDVGEAVEFEISLEDHASEPEVYELPPFEPAEHVHNAEEPVAHEASAEAVIDSTADILTEAVPFEAVDPAIEAAASHSDTHGADDIPSIHTDQTQESSTPARWIPEPPTEEGPANTDAVQAPEEPDEAADAPAQIEEPTSASSRRKRQQQKSVRARKDKLRSAAAVAKPATAEPAAKPHASKSGWLVPPERAAKFETTAAASATPASPVVSEVPTAAAPPTVLPNAPALPAAPIVAAPPPPPAMPRFGAPAPQAAWRPSAPAPANEATSVVKLDSPGLKLKSDSPAPRKRTPSIVANPRDLEPVAALPYVHRGPTFEIEDKRGFPWKLAAAVIAIVATAAVVGRAYLPGRMAGGEGAAKTEAASPAPAPASSEAAPGPADGKGQIIITTEPAGARVLLDGKTVGDSPLTIDAVPGRHTVTLMSSSGPVKRTVRVTAGKSITLDVPVFSGFLAIFGPVVMNVSEDGKSLGTTEESRLMLAPGHHRLTLTNRELGYNGVQEVDIEAGEVTSITIDPRGSANFNAAPWAEVWMDGRKLGDTPMANHPVPLGLHDFIFKNPQFGERRVTATIRADQAAALSVDFNKPQLP
jgi:PEGA domain-containing protein